MLFLKPKKPTRALSCTHLCYGSSRYVKAGISDWCDASVTLSVLSGFAFITFWWWTLLLPHSVPTQLKTAEGSLGSDLLTGAAQAWSGRLHHSAALLEAAFLPSFLPSCCFLALPSQPVSSERHQTGLKDTRPVSLSALTAKETPDNLQSQLFCMRSHRNKSTLYQM